MNIIQFLDEVGHSKLTFQLLQDCIQGATKRRGGFTEIRFGTKELDPSDLVGAPRRVGIIIWMSTEDYERVRLTIKEPK